MWKKTPTNNIIRDFPRVSVARSRGLTQQSVTQRDYNSRQWWMRILCPESVWPLSSSRPGWTTRSSSESCTWTTTASPPCRAWPPAGSRSCSISLWPKTGTALRGYAAASLRSYAATPFTCLLLRITALPSMADYVSLEKLDLQFNCISGRCDLTLFEVVFSTGLFCFNSTLFFCNHFYWFSVLFLPSLMFLPTCSGLCEARSHCSSDLIRQILE